MTSPLWAMIPLKDPISAKSRLAAALSEEARRQIFALMARRVILAARATPEIAEVAVITPSAEVAGFARALGAQVLADEARAGTAAACRSGLAQLRARAAGRVLILPGDLPLARAADLSALIAQAQEPGIVLVPDRRGEGTNALLLAPPDAIAPAFGPGSARAHEAAALAAGLALAVARIPALQLDIDDVPDLEALRALLRDGDPLTQGLDPALTALLRERDPPPSDE